MNGFSISQLGQYSGIKPHTIRAWERRYDALRSYRSKGNTRYYDGCQMRRMLNIVNLIEAGYKASHLCILSDDQVLKLLNDFYGINGNETPNYFISQLIAAGLTFDEAYFDEIFKRCLLCYELKQTYLLVLLPMLERIGVMWKCNKASVAHEHFISNIIRQKLFSAADAMPCPGEDPPKWLLFLPEDELHDIGLLMAYNLIRLSGKHAIYLGSDVPFQALKSAIQQIAPDNLFVFLVNRYHAQSLTIYLDNLCQHFPAGNIYIANHNWTQLASTAATQRIQWLRNAEDLSTILDAI